MLRLYDSRLSGNSWKVRILLSQLERPYERITLDLEKGEASEPAFRVLSRFLRVPVLQLEDGRTIVESGAILLYLAQGTPFLPDDAFLRAEVVSWLFFEQADLQRAIAVPRVYHIRGLAQSKIDQIERFQAEGYSALLKLERWLVGKRWLVGDIYTVADLAVFAYVSLATEGGYDMAKFVAIREWISRVEQQPRWTELLQGVATAPRG